MTDNPSVEITLDSDGTYCVKTRLLGDHRAVLAKPFNRKGQN